MTKEIERKWLCDDWPNDLPLLHDWDVEQIYIYAAKEVEIRIRRKIDRAKVKFPSYKLTTKLGNGIERVELEVSMTEEEYNTFKSVNIKYPIKKHFRVYRLGDCELHVSRVDDKWFYAEIEFQSLEEAKAFVLPFDWKEVTNDASFQMKNYWIKTRFNQIN